MPFESVVFESSFTDISADPCPLSVKGISFSTGLNNASFHAEQKAKTQLFKEKKDRNHLFEASNEGLTERNEKSRESSQETSDRSSEEQACLSLDQALEILVMAQGQEQNGMEEKYGDALNTIRRKIEDWSNKSGDKKLLKYFRKLFSHLEKRRKHPKVRLQKEREGESYPDYRVEKEKVEKKKKRKKEKEKNNRVSTSGEGQYETLNREVEHRTSNCDLSFCKEEKTSERAALCKVESTTEKGIKRYDDDGAQEWLQISNIEEEEMNEKLAYLQRLISQLDRTTAFIDSEDVPSTADHVVLARIRQPERRRNSLLGQTIRELSKRDNYFDTVSHNISLIVLIFMILLFKFYCFMFSWWYYYCYLFLSLLPYLFTCLFAHKSTVQ